jgi:hypothetical protein
VAGSGILSMNLSLSVHVDTHLIFIVRSLSLLVHVLLPMIYEKKKRNRRESTYEIERHYTTITIIGESTFSLLPDPLLHGPHYI